MAKTNRSDELVLEYRDQSAGKLKVLLYRFGGEPIDIGSGSILTMRVAVSPDLPSNEQVKLNINKLVLADTLGGVIPTGGSPVLPTSFKLEQNFPNPFNSSTTIRFEVPFEQGRSEVHTTLTVYNILGQKVRTLLDERKTAGRYHVIWDGRNDQGSSVASGIYFYRLRIGGNAESKKMTLLK